MRGPESESPRWQNGPNEVPAISGTPCRQWTAPLAPGSSQPPRLSRSDPDCFYCFSHCSLHCFPLFLRRRVFSRSFKALHCNWRRFSIADRLYFCAGAHARHDGEGADRGRFGRTAELQNSKTKLTGITAMISGAWQIPRRERAASSPFALEQADYEVGESPLRAAYAAFPSAADEVAASISRKEMSICRRSSQRTLRTQRRLCNSVSRPTAANRG
jgi:hypothetical protein